MKHWLLTVQSLQQGQRPALSHLHVLWKEQPGAVLSVSWRDLKVLGIVPVSPTSTMESTELLRTELAVLISLCLPVNSRDITATADHISTADTIPEWKKSLQTNHCIPIMNSKSQTRQRTAMLVIKESQQSESGFHVALWTWVLQKSFETQKPFVPF